MKEILCWRPIVKACAILIHGFNVADGGYNTVGRLAPFFAEKDIVPITVNYGYFGLLQTRFLNQRVAKRIKEAVDNARHHYDRVIVVGHSNGCAISYLASQMGGFKCDAFIWINPALEPHLAPGPGVGTFHVWYSPSDRPVNLAQLIPKPFRKTWGNMGSRGYVGADDRARNHNKEEAFPVVSKEHSDVFKCEKLAYFGPKIVNASLPYPY